MRIDRLNAMEKYIIEQNTVTLDNLAAHFKVSINTVRRDLDELLKRGQIVKVYGGVRVAQQTNNLVPIPIRNQLNLDEKARIGELASALVPDSSSIFLDSGSTTVHMIKHLGLKKGVSLLTHSLPVAIQASSFPNLNLIMLGGIYNHSTASMFGFSVIDELQKFSVGIAFMAATGVSLRKGLTNNTYMESEIKRHIVANSTKIVLLCDHSKFNHDAMLSFCALDKLAAVVTDAAPSEEYIEYFQKHDIALHY